MPKKSFINFLKNMFKKKKEQKPKIPYNRAIIRFTDASIISGVRDDMTSEIVVYEGDYEKYVFPYSRELSKSIKKIMMLPIYDARQETEELPSYVHVEADEVEYEVPPEALRNRR